MGQLEKRQADMKKLRVMLRDKLICQICKTRVRLKDATVDHILSRGNGGGNGYDNLQLAHKACNNFKNTHIDQPLMKKPNPQGASE